MAHFSVTEARAWAETSKLPISSLDASLEAQVTNIVFGLLSPTFPTSTWTGEATTPALVRTILSMYYVAAVYDKHYAQEEEESTYSITLRSLANTNISGLLSGAITLDEYPLPEGSFQPSFFPNDASSANEPSTDFPSDGGPAFMMGSVF
jgi:hypothetical protein